MKLDSEILSDIFDTLNTVEVQYCVMNNYDDFPNTIPTDVDIAIDEKTFKVLDRFLIDISSKHSVEIVQKIWHGYNKCAYILSPLTISKRFRLQLDFFVDFSAKGYPNLIANDLLLYKRRQFKNFYIPSPGIEVLFIILRRIIKNDLNESHLKKIQRIFPVNSESIHEKLNEILGKTSLSIIALIKSGDKNIFYNNLDNYRKALKNWSAKNTKISYFIKYYYSQVKRTVNRVLYPVGFSLTLLGPDGSGKSTIANSVLERVSGSFHGGKVQYLRPYLLPAMGKLKFWDPLEEATTNPNPHDHPRQNRLKSLLRFFYYLADYLVGYPVKIYWAKIRKNIIIFDRYYYDYLVDLHRYQFNIPRWLPRLFLNIIPSTDITIYLDAEPAELFKRKQELSLPELERQVGLFRKVLTIIPNAYRVSSNKPIDEVVGEITYLILDKKRSQTRRILKSGN